jgi:GNAT superfamily N-acetyltransferase
MKIRYANLDDAEILTKNNVLLARESEKLTIDYKTVFAGVKALLSDQTKGFYLVAEEDNNIIGQMMITFEWSDWHNKNVWWLQSVYVDESWRQKGVFTKLFEAVKKPARKNNVDVLRLYVYKSNIDAKKTYIASGMQEQSYSIYQISLES